MLRSVAHASWKVETVMSQRSGVRWTLAIIADGVNMSELCRRFGISRKTGYKWLRPTIVPGGCQRCRTARRDLYGGRPVAPVPRSSSASIALTALSIPPRAAT